MAGRAESKAYQRQGEYNAQVYEQQAEMIQQQKRLRDYQVNREMARIRGATMARIGKSGFGVSGSPMAIMVENETQMQLDKAIEMWNYDVQRSFAKSGAKESRFSAAEQARLARSQGYSNAFRTMLTSFSSLGMMGLGSVAGRFQMGDMPFGRQGGAGTVIGTTSGYGMRV
jgi:hypothetical protein